MTLGETLGEHVFLYCERGTNVALWAEPFNAISNAGFLLAALIFWQLLLWRPPRTRSADHYLLMALVFLIGLGSLSFHLFATRGTELADVIPISLFMLIYFGFALNRFLEVPPGWTVLLVIAFAGVIGLSTQVNCLDGVIAFGGDSPDAKPCLNGSVGYLPALGVLIVVGMLLAERRHRAAPYVLAAAVIFVASIILRSADLSLCDRVVIEGRDVGTHFIWHLLNALVLFLLLRASLETGTRPAAKDAAPVPAAAAQSAGETAEAADKAQEDEVGDAKETEPEPKAEADDAEAEAEEAADRQVKGATGESDGSDEKVSEAKDDSHTAEPGEKDAPEEKSEPEVEDETPSETDEAKSDPLRPMTAPSGTKASAETPPPDEAPSPDDAKPDEATTPEDVFKAVKALSTDDSSDAPQRKRGSRRRKPPLSD